MILGWRTRKIIIGDDTAFLFRKINTQRETEAGARRNCSRARSTIIRIRKSKSHFKRMLFSTSSRQIAMVRQPVPNSSLLKRVGLATSLILATEARITALQLINSLFIFRQF